MAEELELESNESPNPAEKRIKNLIAKIDEKSQETAEERRLREEAEARAASIEKERDFYASFSDMSAKYSAASEHKEDIKAKVLAGYSVEDATVAVLNAQGKLVPPPPPPPGPAAGGSAPNILAEAVNKTLSEMSREEKLALLQEAERRGDIYLS